MAQSGFTPISIYYSSTSTNVPTAGNLVAGELAINTADGKLFYKDSSGVVQTMASKATGTVAGTTTQVIYNNAGAYAGSANMTYDGTKLTLANDASISGLTVGKGGGSQSQNTAFGSSALTTNSTGNANTATGFQSLYYNTASNNTAYGWQSNFNNSSGTGNTSVGYAALNQNTTSSNNTAIGFQAGYGNTGGGNTYVGGNAATAATTGGNNSAFGQSAGYNLTSGASNVLIGQNTGSGVTTGNNNVMVGVGAGTYTNTVTTGGQNVYIGTNASGSSASVSYEMVIGCLNTVGKGSSTGFMNPQGGGMYQVNNSTLWSVTSDARLKKNIVDNNTGLDLINAIQVRNFEYRLPEEITEIAQDQAIQKSGVQLGAIAQELQAILPECVKQESTGIYTVNADPLIWYLVNAVKELNAKIAVLENK